MQPVHKIRIWPNAGVAACVRASLPAMTRPPPLGAPQSQCFDFDFKGISPAKTAVRVVARAGGGGSPSQSPTGGTRVARHTHALQEASLKGSQSCPARTRRLNTGAEQPPPERGEVGASASTPPARRPPRRLSLPAGAQVTAQGAAGSARKAQAAQHTRSMGRLVSLVDTRRPAAGAGAGAAGAGVGPKTGAGLFGLPLPPSPSSLHRLSTVLENH